ncbi:MAG TPA: stress response translation initiation inhibitor YciH [Dehalococcoidia bacterium]|jgi:translation initiation factor 1|nr:stress response translation initiation inhibitor YciH [Dehalococcoidia bacterium]
MTPPQRKPLYTTDGRMVVDRRPARCSDCQRLLTECVCSNRRVKHGAAADGIVRVSRDRKQRGGKTVTLVTGLPGGEAALIEVAGRLKRLCGSGGTVKDGVVEVQGDHREKVAEALRGMGHTVKLAGG